MIEGDKIVNIGPSAEIKTSASDQVIDLPNATVLPGLIDAHTHLTSDPKDVGYEGLAISVPRATLTGAKNARHNIGSRFHHGAQRRSGWLQRRRAARCYKCGRCSGPRMLVSGPPLGITGGHCDNNMLPSEYHAVGDGVADGILRYNTR